MSDEPNRNGRRLLHRGTASIDASDWLSQDWADPTPKPHPLVYRAFIDASLVAIIAAFTAAVGLAIWVGLRVLGLDLFSEHGLEFAVAVAGSSFALTAFLLAR